MGKVGYVYDPAEEEREEMKVIIAGSRTIRDYRIVELAVSESGMNVTEVVSGGADGVDRVGEHWAQRNGADLTVMYANWDARGRYAGIHRNGRMAGYADALIAVWDGRSNGTRNMIEEMKKRGKRVYEKTVDNRQKGE